MNAVAENNEDVNQRSRGGRRRGPGKDLRARARLRASLEGLA